ncbi:flagellar hook capping protein [Brevibacillus sp. SYP-B805]|uniref:flagellar hook assembly protein FlgD n=1 Tax=Brevibacillus sp. SYP-B805 TaxID=1578199 RepID=UPI0013EB9860|nr:flagellar hook capping FlgD N-terminal domain-containing protein [Brevibacillus sp. SYP-B805]NGQ95685.1 flagellar hook capping protein [Brevibacillus sp. SYP-B805]
MADTVSNTTSLINPAYSYKNKKEFSSELDSNAFMKLMLEQLKYQDPLSPMDNNQFLQQTSMLTMVERLTKIQTLMEESNNSLLTIRKYEELIGRTASYEKVTKDDITGEETREQKTGTINAVKMDNGKIYFQIGEDLVPREQVNGMDSSGVFNDTLMDSTLKYADMVGMHVTYRVAREVDADNNPDTTNDVTTVYETKDGVIAGFAMKDGQVSIQLNDGTTIASEDITGVTVKPDSVPMDSSLKYAQMIGYKVTYTDTDGSEKTGTISAVSMKNGLVEFVLSDNTRLKLNQITGFEAEGIA